MIHNMAFFTPALSSTFMRSSVSFFYMNMRYEVCLLTCMFF